MMSHVPTLRDEQDQVLARAVEELKRELDTSHRREAATAQVLKAITTADLQTVLDTVVESATRLCDADHAYLFLREGDHLRWKSSFGHVAEVATRLKQYFLPLQVPMDRGSTSGRAALEARLVEIPDILEDPEYTWGEAQKIGGWRAALGAPLLRKGEVIGVIFVGKTAPGPFTAKQIELVEIFADQAVIAIENARLFEALQDKSRQLESANTYKSRFLAAASHDLRQPLHALNLFIAQLRAETNLEERARLGEYIAAAVVSMNDLFDALLDMSKLDAGVLEPNLTEFPIQRLLERTKTTFGQAAREKGLHLRVVPSRAWVCSDFILVERILLNLVSNAVRYTERGGVVVGCRRRENWLRVEIWDSGAGIPEDQQQHIFGEFYQLAAPQPGRLAGLGLGLSIVDRLGQLLDHPIELASRLGKGSRFSVSVPLAAARRATADAAEPPATPPDYAKGKLVLVIDDDALVLDGMRGFLQSWGCRVLTAASASAALAARTEAEGKPDLIISDYRLADGKTGIEAIERLRAALGFKVPAFLISGDTGPERLREATASGYHLLHKPVPPMALRTTLNRLLRADDMAR
jgi:signal transduction histidine kinase/CheY-like chemotaxis protein